MLAMTKPPKKRPGEKRPVGRPPVNPPEMSERFMIRCTPDDLERWGKEAARLGLTVGSWVRMIVRQTTS